MSKKPLVLSQARTLPVGRYSAISTLIIGIALGVSAQPASSTWNSTVSFSGAGNLDLSNFGAPGNTDAAPLTLSLSGTSLTMANAGGGGNFGISSSMNVFATVNIPADPRAPAVSDPITMPQTGPDPGLNLTAPGAIVAANPSVPPFYGLFPPAPGTVFSGTVSGGLIYTFGYTDSIGDNTYPINFNGPASLTLGAAPIVVQNGNTYTFTFDDSIVALDANVVFNDPIVDFTGDLVITTTAGSAAAAVPDTSPGMLGALVLLGVSVAGALQKNRTA